MPIRQYFSALIVCSQESRSVGIAFALQLLQKTVHGSRVVSRCSTHRLGYPMNDGPVASMPRSLGLVVHRFTVSCRCGIALSNSATIPTPVGNCIDHLVVSETVGPSRATERPGSMTSQQPPACRVRVLPPGPMEETHVNTRVAAGFVTGCRRLHLDLCRLNGSTCLS